MSLMGRDMRRNRAPGCYLPAVDWADITNPINNSSDCITYIFQQEAERLADIFSELYFEFKALNPDYDPAVEGSEQYTIEYLDCGVSMLEIRNDFLATYGERPLAQLYYFDESNPNSTTGNQKSLRRLTAKLKSVLDQNYYKYKRLAETLGFVYDPISNYDMIEEGTDTNTPTGSETLEHEVDIDKINSVEVSGPVVEYTVSETTDPITEQDVKDLTIKIKTDKKLNTKQEAVSDVRAGRKVAPVYTDPNTNAEYVGSVSDGAGATPTTNHYTTTMDDKQTGRLENYDTTSGDTAQNSVALGETDMPAQGRITAGAPNSPSYTDTKTFENRTDTKDHTLTRKGNIGVTTSQQMIESERQLVRYSLLKEFFEDINRELLLSTWG